MFLSSKIACVPQTISIVPLRIHAPFYNELTLKVKLKVKKMNETDGNSKWC